MVLWGKQNIMLFVLNFKKRDRPHVHSFIWLFNAPNIENEAAHIELTEKTINAQFARPFE